MAVLQRWLWLILLGIFLAAGSAFVVSQRSTPIYEASATLLISEGQKAASPDYTGILTSERLAKTYSEMLKGTPIFDEVKTRLGLSDAEFAKTVNVQLVRDTQLIRLKVRHPDPVLAASIANTIPQVFIEQNEKMQSARFASSKQSLAREMEALQADMESTQRKIEAERAKANPDAAELARLETLLAQYRSSYAGLLQSYEEIRMAEARGLDTVIVIEPAKVPLKPVLPRTLMNTLLAGVVGAMLAVGTAFFIEYLDDTVKSPEDVERVAHLPTFGTIAHFARFGVKGEEPIMAVRPKSAIAEGYRMLRTNLQFSTMGMGGSGAVLLVTSAQPLEGKTTTLANLGVSLAQTGKQVLLVDTDLRRPALHKQFNLQNEAGLTTLLLEREADVDRVIQETSVEGLRVLTAGRIPANPAEVLDFAETTALLERLRSLADYVLLDSPPVLSAADASILAQKVDGVLLVTEMGRTRTEVFRRAVAALEGVKARLLGVVLNKMTARPGGYYYGYYYYYYYYTDDEGKTKKRKRKRPLSALGRFGRLGGAIGKLFNRGIRTHMPAGSAGEDTQEPGE
ncbi:MAG: polysaccharide biosynthesis tyrosine autokinase [Chloroflexi bacterium]|nr:polysaccharide biosynthesis tyrosine autokinase [Chloroflexota bacterium]